MASPWRRLVIGSAHQGSFYMDEDPALWSHVWVIGWAVWLAVVAPTAFFIPFRVWSLTTIVTFAVYEGIGLWRKRDPYPPLTYVCRRYVPRWLLFPAVWAYAGGVGAYWFEFPHPWRLALLLGVVGWVVNHFDVTYDA